MTDPTVTDQARELIEYAIYRCPRDGRTQAETTVDSLKSNPTLLAALAVETGGSSSELVTGTVVDAIHFAKPQTPEDVEHVILHVQVPEGEYEWLLDSQVALVRRVEGAENV